MSNGYAMAGVTAVLRRRLLDAFARADVVGAIGNAPVTVIPPDRVVQNTEPTGVNLYLHQATPNSGWRNVGQPAFTSGGARVGTPPLALDLHYLVTAYGSEPYHAEVLLGQSMLALHDLAVVGPDEIDAALAGGAPPPDPDLPDAVRSSRLSEQVESLRVSLEPMDPEASSRLWSAMMARYRMTAAYLVTVVLLEPAAAAGRALPVRRVGAATFPLDRPIVEAVEDAADADAPILSTATLAIRGDRLVGEDGLGLQVDDQAVTPAAADVTPSRVELPLSALPTPLRAGLHTLQVVHTVDLGEPPTPHDSLRSEPVAFLLRPRITAATATNDSVATVDGVDRGDGTLDVTIDPAVTASTDVRVLLDHLGSDETTALGVPAGNGIVPPATETSTVSVEYADIRTGAHLVRVLVDGAESPVSGTPYDQPQVVV